VLSEPAPKSNVEVAEETFWVTDEAVFQSTDNILFDKMMSSSRSCDIAIHETHEALKQFGSPGFLSRNWILATTVVVGTVAAVREGTFRYQDALIYVEDARVRFSVSLG
jgi:hypothetical protein